MKELAQQREKESNQWGEREPILEREALVRRILVTKEPCKEGAYQVNKIK